MGEYTKMIKGDYLVFSTGKKLYCNGGPIGMCGDHTCLSYGSDGGIYASELTIDEINELVTYVIEGAKAFRVLAIDEHNEDTAHIKEERRALFSSIWKQASAHDLDADGLKALIDEFKPRCKE